MMDELDQLGEEEFRAEQEQFESVLEPDEIPDGYTRDRRTGEVRPKLKSGRPRKDTSESVPAQEAPKDRQGDRAPVIDKRSKPKKERKEVDAPPFRAGPIATGVNKLYRQMGKFVRGFDNDIGNAIISTTRKEFDDDITVGEAWEELARTNPRVRRFLMNMIKGNSYMALLWAHAPILLAILMKPGVMNTLHLGGIVGSFLTPDEDTQPTDLKIEDAQEMNDLLNSQMGQFGLNLPPEIMEMAAQMANNMGQRSGNGTGRS